MNMNKSDDKIVKLGKEQRWEMSRRGRFFRWVMFKIGFSQCRHCAYLNTEAGSYRGMRESLLINKGRCKWSMGSSSSDLTYEEIRQYHRCPGFLAILYNFKDYAIDPIEIKKIADRRWNDFLIWMGWIVAILIAIFKK